MGQQRTELQARKAQSKQHKIMIRLGNLMKGACSILNLLGMDEPTIPSISSLSEWEENLLSYDHPTVVFWRQVTLFSPLGFTGPQRKRNFALG